MHALPRRLHADAVASCLAQGYRNVFQQDAVHLQFPDASFDAVCSFDVLNGIQDDAAAVREAVRVTKPGGLLLFTVGAHPFLWGKTDEYSQHVRRYRRGQLASLFQQAHCRVVHRTYCNSVLFPLVLLQRFSERLLPSKNSGIPGLSLPPPILNALLYTLFSSERFVVPFVPLPLGVSELVLARKDI